jgi:uncharacterized protein YbbK (DUF523 family)
MKPRLGISACLLGQPVRYDGGHKRDAVLIESLGPHVEFFPVCPEVECGLPVPREKMHLVGPTAAPQIVTISSNLDHTERLLFWARARVAELRTEQLCGFIFKSHSPSCGLATAVQSAVGVGLWARVFMETFPQLPVEDEVRLQDVLRRDHFLQQALALAAGDGQNSRATSAKGASKT